MARAEPGVRPGKCTGGAGGVTRHPFLSFWSLMDAPGIAVDSRQCPTKGGAQPSDKAPVARVPVACQSVWLSIADWTSVHGS